MNSLWGRRVLVLEDEYSLADELERMLNSEGAIVIGPYPSLEKARDVPLTQIDGAVLNVRVHDGLSYPLARQLRERNTPFVFASGQSRQSEPEEWRDQVWVSKPYEARQVVIALRRVMGIEEHADAGR